MKVRATPAAGAVTLVLLVSVGAAGCTSSGSTHPSIFTPSPGASASRSAAAGSTAKASATATPTTSPSAKVSATRSSSPSPSPSASFTYVATPPPKTASATPYPSGAPQTGGGGTAGLQDGTAIGLGAAAVVAGLSSLAYRRRVKKRVKKKSR
jgi:hypothetical protein